MAFQMPNPTSQTRNCKCSDPKQTMWTRNCQSACWEPQVGFGFDCFLDLLASEDPSMFLGRSLRRQNV